MFVVYGVPFLFSDLWSTGDDGHKCVILIDLIVELLGLIIKPFDNQTES